MRFITLLFLIILSTCVRAQVVNTLPTIDDPQNADRIGTYTRGFGAAFRLDSLKTYFNDSTLAIIALLPTDTDVAATLAAAQAYADANDDSGTDAQTIAYDNRYSNLSLTPGNTIILPAWKTATFRSSTSSRGAPIQDFGNTDLGVHRSTLVQTFTGSPQSSFSAEYIPLTFETYNGLKAVLALEVANSGVSKVWYQTQRISNGVKSPWLELTNTVGNRKDAVSLSDWDTDFAEVQGVAGGQYDGSVTGGPGSGLYVVENIDNSLGDIQIAWPYNLGFNKHYKRRSFQGSYTAWAQDWNSESDGAGSGLDADLLDGQHGAYYYSPANPAPGDGTGTDDQDLTLTGNILAIENDPNSDVDLSSYLDNTDTQLTEAEVDAFANNNGYLTAEVDGSTTNEIQTIDVSTLTGTDLNLSLSGDGEATKVIDLSSLQDGTGTDDQDLTLTGNILAIENDPNSDVDLSSYLDNTDTQLNESQVDAFANNNGYLTAEVDGSTTNEIQTIAYDNRYSNLSLSPGNTIILPAWKTAGFRSSTTSRGAPITDFGNTDLGVHRSTLVQTFTGSPQSSFSAEYIPLTFETYNGLKAVLALEVGSSGVSKVWYQTQRVSNGVKSPWLELTNTVGNRKDAVSLSDWDTDFAEVQGVAGGQYDGSVTGGPGSGLYVVENIDNSLGDIQIAWPYNLGFNKHYKRRSFQGSYTAWAQDWNSESDGAGSGLDADLLDGQHGAYYYSPANPAPGDGTGTDNQNIDVATFDGTNLNLSLSSDGEATKVIDLSSLKDENIIKGSSHTFAGNTYGNLHVATLPLVGRYKITAYTRPGSGTDGLDFGTHCLISSSSIDTANSFMSFEGKIKSVGMNTLLVGDAVVDEGSELRVTNILVETTATNVTFVFRTFYDGSGSTISNLENSYMKVEYLN
jgi:hypothetical protein